MTFAHPTDLHTLTTADTAELLAVFADLHRAGPVHPATCDGVDIWLVTGHDAARQLLTDRRFSSDPSRANAAALASPRLALDATAVPPAVLRRWLANALTPSRLHGLRAAVARSVGELLDALATRKEADLVADFALPLPIPVIRALLGVPAERDPDFRRWTTLLVATDPAEVALIPGARAALMTYLAELVEAKRERPGDDVLSALLEGAVEAAAEAAVDGDRPSTPDLAMLAFQLIAAAHETTMNLIGTGMLTLLERPDELAALQVDPGRIDAAIEEFLRFESPVKVTGLRFAVEDLEFAGVPMRAGDVVAVLLMAANHDPHRFAAAGQFAPDAPGASHLAFGAGGQACLGAPLARLQAQLAFRGLLARFTDFTLAVPRAELAWRDSFYSRGLVRLPISYK
jgi:cytochrome P450